MVLNSQSDWGVLRCVRPVKILRKLLDEGHSEEYSCAHMMDTYGVSTEKVRLCLEIAKKEIGILNKNNYKEGYSVYIGIPFCPTICSYCTFGSYPFMKNPNLVQKYVEVLTEEIKSIKSLNLGNPPDSIYLGGGTPTSLSSFQLDTILKVLMEVFSPKKKTEITVEAGRPDSITREKLKILKEYDVNRISINPQTMVDKTLKIIGRQHTAQDIIQAYTMARELEFDNINMDVIVALPDESKSDVEYTLKEIQKLDPENLTVHTLAMKRASEMTINKEAYSKYNYQNNKDTMELTARYAKEMGMKPYYMYRQKNTIGNTENTGYAKVGKEGLYNILMMEEIQSIVALGAGSISKKVFPGGKITRSDNVKNVEQYVDRIEEMKKRKRELFCLKNQD